MLGSLIATWKKDSSAAMPTSQLRPVGTEKLGTRTEMKNLNSISNVKAAIEYEIDRQTEVLNGGGSITKKLAVGMSRAAVAFRYVVKRKRTTTAIFPILILCLCRWIVSGSMSLKPNFLSVRSISNAAIKRRSNYHITLTSVLCVNRELCEFFEDALQTYEAPKQIANYITNDLLRELSAASGHGDSALDVGQCKLTPAHIGILAKIIDEGIILNR